MSPDDCDNDICASTQLLQTRRYQLITFQQSL